MAANKKRKITFTFITLLIPVLFFVILEALLQLFNYGGNLNLFVTAHGEYDAYYKCNPVVTKRYFFNQKTIPDPSNDLFRKEKPDNGYRIFVMGGSTTAGYPYGENLMFSRILHKRLAYTFPDREIEVVNTATTAINTYTLLDFIDEILEQEPDLILIYSGHNEFYGALGVASAESLGRIPGVVKTMLELQKFKTVLLLRSTMVKIASLFKDEAGQDPTATLMERLVEEQTILYGSDLYEAGKAQFRQNLDAIQKKIKKAGVQVMVSELVSNVRDHAPFVSKKTGDYPPAYNVFNQARVYEMQKNYDEAREKYYRAKDLDALRFRAAEDFNRIIYEVAEKNNAIVVPMKAFFEEVAINGLIGNNLMVEHLHPNIEGYYQMGRAFYETMRRHKLISETWQPGQNPETSSPASFIDYSALDSVYGALRIKILKGGWPFKPRTAPNRALLDFKPKTKPEQLAVKIWKDKSYDLEHGHVDLAAYYENQKRYDLAFKEYAALMQLTPYNVSPYLKAANTLFKMSKYELALPILRQSLKYEDTGFAHKWIGQIQLQKRNIETAVSHLEKAVQSAEEDPQLLYNLSGAYALSGQKDKARQTLNTLENLTPDFPGLDLLKKQINSMQ